MMQQSNSCTGCDQSVHTASMVNLVAKPCQSCGVTKISGKLGTCKQCIFMASFGTVFGWVVYLALLLSESEKNVRIAAVGISSVFTFLLVAHFIAYVIKNPKAKNEV